MNWLVEVTEVIPNTPLKLVSSCTPDMVTGCPAWNGMLVVVVTVTSPVTTPVIGLVMFWREIDEMANAAVWN